MIFKLKKVAQPIMIRNLVDMHDKLDKVFS